MTNRILVIDFEPKSLAATVELLVAGGYEVQSADSARSVTDALRDGTPDLVVIEPMIPGQDGFKLCQSLKRTDARRPPLIVVASRIYRGPRFRGLAREAGADAFLERPQQDDALLPTIAKLFAALGGSGAAPEAIAVARTPAIAAPIALDASPSAVPSAASLAPTIANPVVVPVAAGADAAVPVAAATPTAPRASFKSFSDQDIENALGRLGTPTAPTGPRVTAARPALPDQAPATTVAAPPPAAQSAAAPPTKPAAVGLLEFDENFHTSADVEDLPTIAPPVWHAKDDVFEEASLSAALDRLGPAPADLSGPLGHATGPAPLPPAPGYELRAAGETTSGHAPTSGVPSGSPYAAFAAEEASGGPPPLVIGAVGTPTPVLQPGTAGPAADEDFDAALESAFSKLVQGPGAEVPPAPAAEPTIPEGLRGMDAGTADLLSSLEELENSIPDGPHHDGPGGSGWTGTTGITDLSESFARELDPSVPHAPPPRPEEERTLEEVFQKLRDSLPHDAAAAPLPAAEPIAEQHVFSDDAPEPGTPVQRVSPRILLYVGVAAALLVGWFGVRAWLGSRSVGSETSAPVVQPVRRPTRPVAPQTSPAPAAARPGPTSANRPAVPGAVKPTPVAAKPAATPPAAPGPAPQQAAATPATAAPAVPERPAPAPVSLQTPPPSAAEADAGAAPLARAPELDAPLKLLSGEKPPSTPEAEAAGTSGRVFLNVLVGPDGTVHDARVMIDPGYGLGEVARTAVLGWRFSRPTREGAAVRVWKTEVVEFKPPGQDAPGR